MRSFVFSFQFILLCLILSISFIFLVVSWNIYSHAKQINSDNESISSQKSPSIHLEEIKSLFSSLDKEPNKFEVIERKNLFSPQRAAWQPPPPQKEKPQKKEEVREPRLPDRSDVVLYGTYISNSTQKAILHFKRFSSSPRSRVVKAGQTVRDTGDSKKEILYKVTKITPQVVHLVDDDDRSFAVDIHDHEVKAKTRQQDTRNISISSSRQKSQTTVVGQAPQKKSDSATSRKKDIQRLSEEAKEKMGKEGKLKKINTPFGTIYREK